MKFCKKLRNRGCTVLNTSVRPSLGVNFAINSAKRRSDVLECSGENFETNSVKRGFYVKFVSIKIWYWITTCVVEIVWRTIKNISINLRALFFPLSICALCFLFAQFTTHVFLVHLLLISSEPLTVDPRLEHRQEDRGKVFQIAIWFDKRVMDKYHIFSSTIRVFICFGWWFSHRCTARVIKDEKYWYIKS